jgi:hypothetical protein
MKLDKIISMANAKSRLRFLGMERSLRATGCQLPLWVIPYDDDRFDLPHGSSWWEVPEIIEWLAREASHRHPGHVMRKYQCLTTSAYQFVDADVIFLRNPEQALLPYGGFVTSCGHWHDPGHTVTKESQAIFKHKSTLWPAQVFNSGQFACDQRMYDVMEIIRVASMAMYRSTCLEHPFHEQPGLNLLVFLSGAAVTNLTLPPTSMQSTWAGDYEGDYLGYWSDERKKPYLIHWAGVSMTSSRIIHEEFLKYLTPIERAEWERSLSGKARGDGFLGSARRFTRRVWGAWNAGWERAD